MAQSNFGFHRKFDSYTTRDWFDRCVGKWTSRRRYIFNMKTMEPQNYVTNFEIKAGEPWKRLGDNDGDVIDYNNQWIVTWTGETEGEMVLTLSDYGTTLSRSRDYFGKGAHDARIKVIDKDCIVLHTAYSGMKFREEIRFLANDTLRLRQTIGYDENTGEPRLVGQYYEVRI